jgi:hypothetical protein
MRKQRQPDQSQLRHSKGTCAKILWHLSQATWAPASNPRPPPRPTRGCEQKEHPRTLAVLPPLHQGRRQSTRSAPGGAGGGGLPKPPSPAALSPLATHTRARTVAKRDSAVLLPARGAPRLRSPPRSHTHPRPPGPALRRPPRLLGLISGGAGIRVADTSSSQVTARGPRRFAGTGTHAHQPRGTRRQRPSHRDAHQGVINTCGPARQPPGRLHCPYSPARASPPPKLVATLPPEVTPSSTRGSLRRHPAARASCPTVPRARPGGRTLQVTVI